MSSPKPHSGAHTPSWGTSVQPQGPKCHPSGSSLQAEPLQVSFTPTPQHHMPQLSIIPTLPSPHSSHSQTLRAGMLSCRVGKSQQRPSFTQGAPRAGTAQLLEGDTVGHFLLQQAFSKQPAAQLGLRPSPAPPAFTAMPPNQKGPAHTPRNRSLQPLSDHSNHLFWLQVGFKHRGLKAQDAGCTCPPLALPSLLVCCQIRSCNMHARVLQEQFLIQIWTNMQVVYLK